eukprot:gene7940-16266_t
MSEIVDNKDIAAEEFKRLGNEAFAAKKYNDAINFYDKALELTPSNPILYSNRSACHASNANWEKALADAKECISKDENFIKGYFRLATAQEALKLFDDAISTLQKGLAKDPENELFMKQIRLTRAKASAAKKPKQRKMDEATQREYLELQDQTNAFARDLRLVQAKLASSQKHSRSNQVTTAHINTLNEDVPLYRSVGKAFVHSTREDVIHSLDNENEKLNSTQKDLMDRKEFLERRITSNASNLQDMVAGY